MADDLVKRLNDKWRHSEELCYEAAAEIERLREALEYYAKNHYPNVNDGPWGVNSNDFGDVARAALNKTEEDDA